MICGSFANYIFVNQTTGANKFIHCWCGNLDRSSPQDGNHKLEGDDKEFGRCCSNCCQAASISLAIALVCETMSIAAGRTMVFFARASTSRFRARVAINCPQAANTPRWASRTTRPVSLTLAQRAMRCWYLPACALQVLVPEGSAAYLHNAKCHLM